MKVIEIFSSIDGEGITAGYPAVFIRLAGCNLRCSYCDTQYSYDGGKEMCLEEIMDKVMSFGIRRVTVTGGEPLIHRDIGSLLGCLLISGMKVNVETNGSVDVRQVVHFIENSVTLDDMRNLFFTIDYKLSCSGQQNEMCFNNFRNKREEDIIKFVVGSKEDLEQTRVVCELCGLKDKVFISPVFGKIQPSDIVQFILDNHMDFARVQLQMHKIIWDPDKRGV